MNRITDRAPAANRIFGPTFPDETSLRDAARADAQYLFVAKSWDGYVASRAEAFWTMRPDVVVFENAAVVVEAVPIGEGRATPN